MEWENNIRNWQDLAIDAEYDFPDSAMSSLKSIINQALDSQMSDLRKEAVEPLAKAIYDQMSYTENGVKPEWIVGGNSLKQDEARRIALKALDEVLLLMKK